MTYKLEELVQLAEKRNLSKKEHQAIIMHLREQQRKISRSVDKLIDHVEKSNRELDHE